MDKVALTLLKNYCILISIKYRWRVAEKAVVSAILSGEPDLKRLIK